MKNSACNRKIESKIRTTIQQLLNKTLVRTLSASSPDEIFIGSLETLSKYNLIRRAKSLLKTNIRLKRGVSAPTINAYT
jgi:hypothetical protein